MSWTLSEAQTEKFPVFEAVTFVIGNTHQMKVITKPGRSAKHRHVYTFFVRPSKPEYVAEMKVVLHETYRDPVINLFSPPFEVRAIAWGYFDVRVDITLKAGFSFHHEQSELVDGRRARLRLDWELDFDGDGSQGWLKVVVERTKSKLTEYDEKLGNQITKLRSLQAAGMMVRMIT